MEWKQQNKNKSAMYTARYDNGEYPPPSIVLKPNGVEMTFQMGKPKLEFSGSDSNLARDFPLAKLPEDLRAVRLLLPYRAIKPNLPKKAFKARLVELTSGGLQQSPGTDETSETMKIGPDDSIGQGAPTGITR